MIEPVGHRVIVLPDKVEERTAGGLYLPEQAREKEQHATQTGTLVGVGPQAWKGFDDGTPWAKLGDKVIFAKYGGSAIDGDNGEKLKLLNDEDILGVVR